MVETEISRRKRAAPYVPASTLSQFFDHIRYVQTPKKVDSNLVQDYGTSKSHAFALISTLKFLGLTDDRGEPTPIFRSLQTGGDEFKNSLHDVLMRAYSDLFERLDVTRDSRDKIVNFFARNYSPATAERATALFLDLCGEAGIETAAQPRVRTPNKLPKSSKVVETKEKQIEQSPQEVGEQDTKTAARGQRETPPDNGQSSEQFTPMTGMSIRIDSKDLASMNSSQIQALFDGLSKIMSQNKNEKEKQ